MDCSFPWTLAGWLGVIKLQASHPAHQAGWMIDKSGYADNEECGKHCRNVENECNEPTVRIE
jgi:hypothetical protein